jgi:uncharacterized protein with HEPN domain
MRAMRNVVVHEYFGIDDDLKPLAPLLATLLTDQDDAG